jgi:hypothetical protein
MIRSVIANGINVDVSNGFSVFPSFYMNPQNPMIGTLRINGCNQNLETFNGAEWITIQATIPVISMRPQADLAINWAIKKMEEDEYILGLSKEYPAIKDLLDNIADTKNKIDMIVALVGKEVPI